MITTARQGMRLPAVVAGLGLLLSVWFQPARAADDAPFRPAVAYSFAGKDNSAFNRSAALGVGRFVDHYGVRITEFNTDMTMTAATDAMERGVEALLEQGADPVLTVGYAYVDALKELAPRYPDRRFIAIDAVVDQPNVASILFREDQGSFLVGLLAAHVATSGKVGFIGGMDMGLIHRFECGFRHGARHANPAVDVLVDYHPGQGGGFSDPAWGRATAAAQFDRGADVVFAAAGSTGSGVFEAAVEHDKLAIGVDTNENGAQPGHILTSMLKRVDVAVYRSLVRAKRGEWKAGIETLGLAEEAVGWALDQHNAALITADMQEAANQAQFGIISEQIVVGDSADFRACLAEQRGQ